MRRHGKRDTLLIIFYKNLFYRVRVYGPGIEPSGPVIGAPATFTVETFSAGKGNVDVNVKDAEGNNIPVRIFVKIDRTLPILCYVMWYLYSFLD